MKFKKLALTIFFSLTYLVSQAAELENNKPELENEIKIVGTIAIINIGPKTTWIIQSTPETGKECSVNYMPMNFIPHHLEIGKKYSFVLKKVNKFEQDIQFVEICACADFENPCIIQ